MVDKELEPTEAFGESPNAIVEEEIIPEQRHSRCIGLEVLNSVQDLVFHKPDLEVFDASVLYEITSGSGQKLFYAFRKSPSKFQPQCDIHINDTEGHPCLRLVNPKKHPQKIIVRNGGSTLGYIFQTNILWFTSPEFIIRDSKKQELGIILPMNDLCCLFSPTGFEIIRRKDEEGKKLIKEEILAGLVKDVVLKDDEETLIGRIGIDFAENVNMDVNIKCLLIAAAIFIDFSVFNSNGGTPWKILISVAVTILLLLAVMITAFVIINLETSSK